MKWICTSVRRYIIFIVIALVPALMANCSTPQAQGNNQSMQGSAPGTIIEGTATYRERIAIPPNSVFEAVLEDVTIADARATQIGRTSFSLPAGPPIGFSITFDPSQIDPGRIYSVRARILVNGRLMFTSDKLHPVLTRGAGHTVNILLKMVGRDTQN